MVNLLSLSSKKILRVKFILVSDSDKDKYVHCDKNQP